MQESAATRALELTSPDDSAWPELVVRWADAAFQGGEVNAVTGSYSPDGRWIVYRLTDHGSFALYKLPARGGQPRHILSLPVAIAFFLFEVLLIATLQAFIFSMLTAIYIGGATAESH